MCDNGDGTLDALASFSDFEIASARERDSTIRNFIDIINIDRNASGNPTLVEHEALDSLNDMIATNLYCPIGEIGFYEDPMTFCTTMSVGDRFMEFKDFIRNSDKKGVVF